MTAENVSPVDLRLLVLREAIQPLVRLARISGLTLDDLQALVGSAYYREFRQRGHSHQMMTRHIGKSLRSVANLAKKDKDTSKPLAGSELLNAKRDVATRVGKASMTRSEVARQYQRARGETDVHALVEEAIDQLLTEGILEALPADATEDETLQQGAGFISLLGSDLEHRLASLRHLLSGTTAVIYHRFFKKAAADEAFARVLSFRVREDALEEVAAAIYAGVRDAAIAEDDASTGDERPVTLTITMSRAPAQREW